MKTLFRACAVCLFWFGFAHAAVEGDPFSDGQAFSDLHAIEASDTFLLGGFAESRNQCSLNDPETPISLRQKVQVEALWRRDVLSLFGSLEGSYEGAAHTWPGDHSPWKADLRELYLTYDTDNIDIFLGRKTHRWGTGDGINPMDLIKPLDTRDPVTTGRADNRLPVWLFSGTVSGNGISFEGVFLPKAEVNALPRSGNPWEPRALRELRRQRDDGLFTITDPDEPDRWFRDVEYGGRLSANIGGWDLALMAFHGFVDNPMFVSRDKGDGMRWTAEYPRFTAFGTSFAKGFGSQTVRGEVAYKPRFPVQGSFGFHRADLWQGVLGWDYDIDSKYYLNFQLFGDVQEGSEASGSRTWHGATYEISGKWFRDALKTGVRGKLYTSGEGTLTEVFLEYELDDHWKASTGVMFWTGGENTILGEYTDNDFVYLTLRYAF